MMYPPPPGYVDLLSDAEAYPAVTGDTAPLEVDGVGTLMACKPDPASVASLAVSGSPDYPPGDRTDHLVRFVARHLDGDELERLYLDMMLSKAPATGMESVARALSTWGTARPYVAVVTLAVMTGHHWRTLRSKLLSAGVANPMTLPSMHVLLDFTESIISEALASGEDAKTELDTFNRKLYGPTPEALRLNGPDYVPPGFSDEDVEASFDAFARAAR
mgnify:CR=1 FL=1